MKRSRKSPWPWIGLAGFFLLVIGGIGLSVIALMVGGQGIATGARVGLIEYSGAVTDEGTTSVVGITRGGARQFIKDVERARRDTFTKAVVIRINSPGGSASASQEMYQAIRRLRQKKPVVCSMADVAASGGYYMAVACDKIYANPSTITGSIGVISLRPNLAGLLQKWGVKANTQKTGRFKDMGNPFAPIDPAHVQLEQALIQNIYQQFITDVLAGRKNKLTRAQLLKLADGRIYTGTQAKANGLIDSVGGLRDAIEAAALLGGVKPDTTGNPPVKNFSEVSLFGSIDPEAGASSTMGQAALQMGHGFAVTLGRAFADALVERLKAESNTPALPRT